ncbi:hypothetical protein LSM04_001992 [Trypanosoma melophagium]|uniref:uncharacterized protein n=1 Tax=Trypanosoma melophagium TaxID=715481 RepID=UPI00351AA98C|nr:hypothetical protein LSM04_001992 [Trypanosoma melophagium]
MEGSPDVEEILIHPSVTLAVIERGSNNKLTLGENAIASLGRVHATAAHPYTLRLRNGNSSRAFVYRVTTRNAHWWWAQGTHGVLYPPSEEEDEFNTINSGSDSSTSRMMYNLESENKSMAYISLRVKEPERIDRLHKEWSVLSNSSTSVKTMNSEENITSSNNNDLDQENQMQREPEGETAKVNNTTATTTTSTSSSLLSLSPLPSSYVRGKTTTAVDFIRIMFAELPATHPLLHKPQIVEKDVMKSDFLTWWNKVMTAATAIATTTNTNGNREKEWQYKKETQEVYTGVTVFTLPVKVAFLSERRFWASLSADTRRVLSNTSNTRVLIPSEESVSLRDDEKKKEKHVLISAGINYDDVINDSQVGFFALSLAIVAIICSFLAGAGLV